MFSKKHAERQHICTRCESVFYSPAKRPAAPNRMAVAGAKMQATGSSMSVFSGGASKGGYQMQAMNMQNKRDFQKQWDHPTCPGCGSRSINTRTVKK